MLIHCEHCNLDLNTYETINRIRLILILGAVAIVGLLFFQGLWLLQSYDLKEEEFHHEVSKSLHTVAENIAAYNKTKLPKSKLIQRRSSNYYSVNVNSAIDANILEDYLVRAFTEASMDIEFEYAVYDCADDEYLYSNYCNLTEGQDKESVSENHPKFDDLTYYFVVQFPSRSSSLIKDLRIPLLFSALTILSILAFVYAIWVILRQQQETDLQTDFINNMTHEFKTPISSIKLASDYLLTDKSIKGDQRLHKYANIIKQQNVRLNKQVEKVLNLARLEKDQFKLKKDSVNLQTFIEEVVDQESIRYENKNGRIDLQLAQSPIYLEADKLHFNNVLSNILDNALKYCIKEPSATVTLTSKPNSAQLTIKDNGIGISKENQKKIYNKFYRVPTGDVHDVKGFGLGLFYVKQICDSHGWKLLLQSEENKGTTITINFPKINTAA